MEWLPKLVGIEGSIGLRLADGGVVRAMVDEAHGEQLTRDEITASVHYIRWELTPEEIERFAAGPATLVSDHPEYSVEAPLREETTAELIADLRNGG